jgi:hypothetical protein
MQKERDSILNHLRIGDSLADSALSRLYVVRIRFHNGNECRELYYRRGAEGETPNFVTWREEGTRFTKANASRIVTKLHKAGFVAESVYFGRRCDR